MKKTLYLVMMLFVCIVLLGLNGYSQKMFKDGLNLKSNPVELTRGSNNPNILKGPPLIDDQLPQPPKTKGGKDGDCGCEISFDNYTGFCIELYLDGIYQGTVGSWQKSIVINNSGNHIVYLINTSNTKEWKVEGACKGKYTWKISL